EFPGATPDQLPALQAASRRLTGAAYVRSGVASVAQINFLPICLQRGYLKARFGDSEAKIADQAKGKAQVDLIFPLIPGPVNSTSAVEWKGKDSIATNDLQRLLHLPIGQPADAVRLNKDVEEAAQLYRSHGYMTARIASTPAFDDDKNSVRYELAVAEGPQFKMGELEILGLDSQARGKLEAAFKLREGEPYDGLYAKKFLDDTMKFLPPGIHWGVSIHEAVNEKDHTVDLTIRFNPR